MENVFNLEAATWFLFVGPPPPFQQRMERIPNKNKFLRIPTSLLGDRCFRGNPFPYPRPGPPIRPPWIGRGCISCSPSDEKRPARVPKRGPVFESSCFFLWFYKYNHTNERKPNQQTQSGNTRILRFLICSDLAPLHAAGHRSYIAIMTFLNTAPMRTIWRRSRISVNKIRRHVLSFIAASSLAPPAPPPHLSSPPLHLSSPPPASPEKTTDRKLKLESET